MYGEYGVCGVCDLLAAGDVIFLPLRPFRPFELILEFFLIMDRIFANIPYHALVKNLHKFAYLYFLRRFLVEFS